MQRFGRLGCGVCFGEHGVLMSVNNLKKWIHAGFQDDGNSLSRHFYFIEKRWLISKKRSLLASSYSFTLVCRDVFNDFFCVFFWKPTNTTYLGQAKFLQGGSHFYTKFSQSQENEFVDLDVKAFASPLGRHKQTAKR